MAEQELLTVSDVAVRLRLSNETVRRMLRDGRIRGIHIGSARSGWRVRVQEIERFKQEGPLVQ